MLEKAFELAVVFSAVDKMTGPISSMATQLGILDEKTKAVQQRLNEFKNMTFVGGAITAAGIGLAKIMEDGIDTAGKFLSTMTMIQDTTGATADQMDRIQKTIRDSSGSTIFGIQDTANYAKLLATSGMNGNQIDSLLPLFTQYAEVQKLGKGSSPEEAITQAIAAAHTVGAYDPDQLSSFLDKYNKSTFMQPGSSSEFADTFKYMASRTSGMNLSTDDMLTMSALSNRVGLAGSIGGTEASDMILRTIPGLMSGTGKKDSKQTAALKELGLSDTIYDSDGQFKGVANLIDQLGQARDKFNPEQFAKLAHDAFGQQGMGLAEILGTDRGKDQLKALQEQMGSMKSIGQMQEDTNKTPEGQMLQLKTNIENLKLDVWLQLAQILNPIFMQLNNIVSKVQEFSSAHPEIAKLAAEFLTFATAAALIVGPLLVLVGVIGYLREASAISTGFKLLGTAFKGALGPMFLLISAGYLLYQAWQTDFGGIREKTKATFDWIKSEIPIVEEKLHSVAKALGFETDKGFQIPKWVTTLMGLFVGGKTINFALGGLSKLSSLGKVIKGIKGIKLGASLFKVTGNLGSGLLNKIFGKATIDLGKRITLKGLNLLKGSDTSKLIGQGLKGIPSAVMQGLKGIGPLLKSTLKEIPSVMKLVGATLKTFGSFALDAGKAALGFGANLIKLGGQALMAAGRMAAAWLIGLGPVGWIIAGIIAILAVLWLAWSNNWGHIREHFAETVKWISDKWHELENWFNGLGQRAEEWGKNLIQGFVNGIESLAGWIKDKVSGFFDSNVVKTITGLLGIHSPSKLMHEFGQYTVQGFANGMNNDMNLVSNASSRLTDLAQPSLQNSTNGSASLNGSASNGAFVIQPGAIVINAAPGQSADEIAEAVMQKIARKLRNQSNSRSTSYVPQW